MTVCWSGGVWIGCIQRQNSALHVSLEFLGLEEDSYPQTPRLSGSIFAPQRSKEYGELRGMEMQGDVTTLPPSSALAQAGAMHYRR